jgi:hypothetical protein
MNRTKIFQVLRSGRFSALVALVGLGLLFTASGVKAGGCSVIPYKAGAAASARFLSPQAADGPSNHQEAEELNEPATIVGLWHLNYTAESEFGAPIFPSAPFPFLESFKIWHSDGTEFENAFMAPAGGNICFGVWKDLGHGSVKLHHIGLMFAQAGTPPEYVGTPPEYVTNIFTVDETDTVAPNGNSYSGHFDFKLWPPSFDLVGVGTPIAEVKGITAGTRITVD